MINPVEAKPELSYWGESGKPGFCLITSSYLLMYIQYQGVFFEYCEDCTPTY